MWLLRDDVVILQVPLHELKENTVTQHLTPEDIAIALDKHPPTKEQSAIISSPLVPRLVVAGAGSGKTATMVDRVVWLVANGKVRADQVLGVTFTRKAAGELRGRMRTRLEELRRRGLLQIDDDTEIPVTDPVISTYHSYANTLVANYGLRLGVEQDAQMLGGAQAWQLVAQLVEHLDPRLLPVEPPAKSSIISGVLQLSSELAEHLQDPQTVIDWCRQNIDILQAIERPGARKKRDEVVSRLENRAFYAELVRAYARVKKNMQVMDFGDLVAFAARIAREIPQAGEAERDRFRVVLLDEFQDTSHAQMQLFSDLFAPSGQEPRHPVMAVGDPKQSIYGFRGASDGQLFSFYDYFPAEDRTASYLRTAWRNDTSILDVANHVAEPLKVAGDWVRVTEKVEVPDLVARPDASTGRVLLGRYATDREEAEAIAEYVVGQRKRFENGPLNKMPTMAILCKKRSMMEPVRLECERAGIPYQIVGLGGLLDAPEVIDMVCVLRVLADPGRSDALMRLMAGARWRIGLSDALALSDWASYLARQREKAIREGKAEDLYARLSDEEIAAEKERERLETVMDITDTASLIEAIETLPKPGWVSPAGRSLSEAGLERLGNLAQELEYLRQFMADDLSILLNEIERILLLDIELAVKPGQGSHGSRRQLDAFYDVAAQYTLSAPRINATLAAGAEVYAGKAEGSEEAEEATEGSFRLRLSAQSGSAAGINGFLSWLDVALAQESGLEAAGEEPPHDAVQILTVHASKGLEWDQVYIPGLNQGDFPLNKDMRWTQNSTTLPWPLRGDKNFLPGWKPEQESLKEFGEYLEEFQEQAAEHSTAEERRLAYVGFTRARNTLMLTSSAWKGSNAKPAEPSIFWAELKEALAAGQLSSEVSLIHDVDDEAVGTVNPQAETLMTAAWPFDPIDGPHVRSWKSEEELDAASAAEALAATESATKAREATAESSSTSEPTPASTPEGRRARLEQLAHRILLSEEDWAAEKERLLHRAEDFDDAAQPAESTQGEERTGPSVEDWQQETDVLLALLNAPAELQDFELPAHLSVSMLVALKADPHRVIAQLQRPMPQQPGIATRQGTVFHRWLESHFEKTAMLDFEDEAFDDDALDESLELPQLQENFLSSEWADLQPWAVEFPLETPVEGISVRGRVDAIYRYVDEDGHVAWELVDWKTGRVPTRHDMPAKSIQLALYRLAFARLQNIPVEDVSAAFFYVASGKTIRPQQLADERALGRMIQQARQSARHGENPTKYNR